MKFIKLLAGAAVCLLASSSFAIPLTLNYQVTNLGSTYQYNFDLVLDNHDNTWVLGHQWDGIVFGDRKGGPQQPGTIPCNDWIWGDSDPGVSKYTSCTGGAHQGPTLIYGTSASLPGWAPTHIGDVLSWSGTSKTLVADGDMFWFPLNKSPWVIGQFYYQANNTSNLPEPGSLLLFALGLIGLGFIRRRVV